MDIDLECVVRESRKEKNRGSKVQDISELQEYLLTVLTALNSQLFDATVTKLLGFS